jgi:hypothetical protein
VYQEDLLSRGSAVSREASAVATEWTSWSRIKRRFLDVDYLEPVSPTNVLLNLTAAYEARAIEPYDALTHPEFVFKASESDPYVTFDVLNAAEDRASTERMFEEVIAIDLDLGGDFEVVASDVDPYVGDRYRKVLASPILISVETRIDEELWTLRVDGDPASFILERDDSVHPPTYSIIYQQDLHVAGIGRRVRETSWGQLKSRF